MHDSINCCGILKTRWIVVLVSRFKSVIFSYIIFNTSFCQNCRRYAALVVHREVCLSCCQISVHLQKSSRHFSQKGSGLVVPVCAASFSSFTIPMLWVDGPLSVLLYFQGALHPSTMLLKKVRNPFLHIFIDSQASERRRRVLSFDFLLLLELADKKHGLIEQTRSDLDDDANDDSEEVLNEMPINMITGHTYYFLISGHSSVCVWYPKPLSHLFAMLTVKL